MNSIVLGHVGFRTFIGLCSSFKGERFFTEYQFFDQICNVFSETVDCIAIRTQSIECYPVNNNPCLGCFWVWPLGKLFRTFFTATNRALQYVLLMGTSKRVKLFKPQRAFVAFLFFP